MRNFLWILAICLFSIFLSKNIASSDDLDHAYEMKDLMYDDSMNPSNLPICSGKLLMSDRNTLLLFILPSWVDIGIGRLFRVRGL